MLVLGAGPHLQVIRVNAQTIAATVADHVIEGQAAFCRSRGIASCTVCQTYPLLPILAYQKNVGERPRPAEASRGKIAKYSRTSCQPTIHDVVSQHLQVVLRISEPLSLRRSVLHLGTRKFALVLYDSGPFLERINVGDGVAYVGNLRASTISRFCSSLMRQPAKRASSRTLRLKWRRSLRNSTLPVPPCRT